MEESSSWTLIDAQSAVWAGAQNTKLFNTLYHSWCLTFLEIFSVDIHALTMWRPCTNSDCSPLYSIPIDMESENKTESEAHIGVFAMPHDYCDHLHSDES